VGIILTISSNVKAQTTDDPWSDPINLSRSGGAIDPHLVVDSDGVVHVIWGDTFGDDVFYVMRDNTGTWSDPKTIRVPFKESLSTLQLIPDQTGVIHAFWRIKGGYRKGYLYYSRTYNTGFESSWSPAALISYTISSQYAAVEDERRIHVAYVNSDNSSSPSGIYYRSSPNAASWYRPVLVYEAPHFGFATPGNTQLYTTFNDQGTVFVAWEDAYLEKVFLVISEDEGITWGEPVELDRREESDRDEAIGPSKIVISAQGEEVLAVWQAGHEDLDCAQYYKQSFDGGETWSERDQVPGSFGDCPDQLLLIPDELGQVWLLANPYLSVWKQGGWSTTQLQGPLDGFVHPETFRRVELEDQRTTLDGQRLLVIGTGGDIWCLSRELGSWEDFIIPTPRPEFMALGIEEAGGHQWSIPVTITQGKSTISTALVQDDRGVLHTFWTQDGSDKIFWATYVDGNWSRPSVLLSSPGGQPEQPEAILTYDGNLFLVWSDRQNGAIYYSWVPSSAAMVAENWSFPVMLPTPGSLSRSPQVANSSEGALQVIFAVPLNEERGIYILEGHLASSEQDESMYVSWSEPWIVFDAESAGWGIVDQPRFTVSADGAIQAIWSRLTLPPDNQPLALYYARSGDNGLTWSVPEEVSDEKNYWSEIVSGRGITQRVWMEETGGRVSLRGQYSTDSGNSWSQGERIASDGHLNVQSSLFLDHYGGAHLVQLSGANAIGFGEPALSLLEWSWGIGESGNPGWEVAYHLVWDEIHNPVSLSAYLAEDGSLALLFSAKVITKDPEEAESVLFFMDRTVDAVQQAALVLPTFTPIPESLITQVVTPAPTPTPRLEFSTDATRQTSPLLGNRWMGIIIGGIPAVLVVVWAVVVGLRRMRK